MTAGLIVEPNYGAVEYLPDAATMLYQVRIATDEQVFPVLTTSRWSSMLASASLTECFTASTTEHHAKPASAARYPSQAGTCTMPNSGVGANDHSTTIQARLR